jgi:diguanylate cyclase
MQLPRTDGASAALTPVADINQTLKVVKQHLTDAQYQITELRHANNKLRQELSLLVVREARAMHDAYHDTLTCLPNRRLLLDRLHQALGQAVRQHKQVVLLLLDLDGFKAVNDRLGHATGDKLLRAVADRLVTCLRSADTACRDGGDEFVVLLPETNGHEDSAAVERKIRAKLSVPYFIDGVELTTSVSIGSAVFPANAKHRSELLQYADTAMYRAKNGGALR